MKKNNLPAVRSAAIAVKETKPIRLTKAIKEYLDDFVNAITLESVRRDKLEVEYENIKYEIKRYVLSKYTLEEMEVLTKFNLTETAKNFRVEYIDDNHYRSDVIDPKEPTRETENWRGRKETRTNYLYVEFEEETETPYYGNNRGNKFSVIKDKMLMEKINTLRQKYDEVRADEHIKQQSYRKVLNAAKTLDELQTVWLDVGNYFSKYVSENNLEVNIDEKISEIVFEDSQKRLEAAAV